MRAILLPFLLLCSLLAAAQSVPTVYETPWNIYPRVTASRSVTLAASDSLSPVTVIGYAVTSTGARSGLLRAGLQPTVSRAGRLVSIVYSPVILASMPPTSKLVLCISGVDAQVWNLNVSDRNTQAGNAAGLSIVNYVVAKGDPGTPADMNRIVAIESLLPAKANKASLDSTNTAITGLVSATGLLSTRVTSTSTAITGLTNATATLAGTVATKAPQSAVDATNTLVTGLASATATLAAQVISVSSTVGSHDSALSNLSSTTAVISSQVNSVSTAVTGLTSATATLSAGLAARLNYVTSSGLFTTTTADVVQFDNGIWEKKTGTITSATPGYGTMLYAGPSGAYYALRYYGPIDITRFGTVGDGSFDNSTALQAAIDFVAINQRFLYIPPGRFKYTTTLHITTRGIRLTGNGLERFLSGTNEKGSELYFTGTGPAIELGTDSGNPYNSNEYNGTGQIFGADHIRLSTARTTGLAHDANDKYTPGTYGIRDWRGGGLSLFDVTFEGFEYGFWGIQSDVNNTFNLNFIFCKTAVYLGPRTDQNTWTNTYILLCDQAIVLDGNTVCRFINPQIMGCGTNTVPAIDVYKGTTLATFLGGWYEHVQGYAGSDGLAFFRIGGVTGYGSNTNPVAGCAIENSLCYTIFGTGAYHFKYFADVESGREVTIRNIQSPIGSALNVDQLVTNANSTSYTSANFDVSLSGTPATQSQSYLNQGTGSPQFNTIRGHGDIYLTNNTAKVYMTNSAGNKVQVLSQDPSFPITDLGFSNSNVRVQGANLRLLGNSGGGSITFEDQSAFIFGKLFASTGNFVYQPKTTTAPTDNGTLFQINGSVGLKLVLKTAAYTATASDYTILCDGTSGAYAVTLPTAVGITGRIYVIKRVAGANTITVNTTSSQTIDGATTYSLSANNKFVSVMSDGTNWQIIANN